ncbi:M20/M25/M40 family metallo-hydrolase [Fulvivirga lutea]|uniref:M20/M25/M40 family metallo-hydrolase n=1 Tax=Fulvivirga lutea TaxID=2810512 RepID=A0A974WEZ4_9BACT|nr:M20/M25/M40 family metallo-hydrolase [Fulvivirga lutea]QSE96454.1 M20/M25/M40 family metallo-hydrolase [Fulvivirga lutea]
MKKLSALLILSLTITSISWSQSDVKPVILKSVEDNTTYYTQLLKEIVNINSGTMNFKGVQKVGNRLVEEFKKLGMEASMTSGDAFGRAGHLVASNNGTKGIKILMIGHLDTVFEPESPFQKYTMVNDSIMQGPGVADMKGGDIIILLALKALKDAGVLENLSVKVVMTGDEERSGSPLALSKKELTDAADWADIALGFENADGNPKTIVTSRRGSTSWTLNVKGNAAHSSQVFTDKVGSGAIYEASRILNSFYQELSKEENLTFNPGLILGGTDVTYDDSKSAGTAYGKQNVVAKDVIVKGDIRAVSLEQLAMAKEVMNRIVTENYPESSAELIFDSEGGYPPLTNTKGNEFLLNLYNMISRELGYGHVTAVNPRNAGAADISFTSGRVDMAVDGLGLSGADDHTINETGNLNMISVQAKRAALLMYRLSSRR